MDLKRFNGTGPVRQYASRSSFQSRIKRRYRLPGIRATTGQRPITVGLTRHDRPFGLVFAAMPKKWDYLSIKWIDNLYIALGLALYSHRNAYTHIRDDKNSRFKNCRPLLSTSSVTGLDHPGDISHSMRIPAGFNHGELAERRETSDKKEYRDHLRLIEIRSSFSRSYKSADKGKIGSLHDLDLRISEKDSSLMPSQLELPAPRGLIGNYETESSPMSIYENGQSHLRKERTPLKQITERMQFMRTYDPDSVDFELQAPGFVSRMIARSIAPPWDMTLIKGASSQSGGHVSSDETGPLKPRSFTEFKFSLPDSNPVLSDALTEGFTPVYRTFPAREAPMQTELERSVISSSRPPDVTESMQLAPTAQDLHRISDQVCSMIERKLLTEKERRGIYG